ncbi:MAG: hypothetical protein IPH62_07035 [Ignavibacteriae bacterium]|nr:hypothetical protein [Ignavibacteriota bacterium]
MNTGQSFLSLGAMVLVSLIVLQVNTGFVSTSSTLLDNKLNILAISLGSSIIEEASGKAFDEKTITDAASTTNDLTYANSLGPSYTESYPNYNDFDDFDGLTINNTSIPSANFTIISEVSYVNANNPDEAVTYPTWHKKITVYITSKSLLDENGNQDTVAVSSIFSYWHFR